MKRTADIYRGGLVLLAGFIFVKAGGFLFKLICMGALPVEAYGEVAVFFVLFNWFVLFATLNAAIGLAKFVSHDQGRKGLYGSSAVLGSLIMSAAVSAVLLAASPSIAAALNIQVSTVLWAVAATPLAAAYNMGIFHLRGAYRMGSSTAADLLLTAARIGALAALLYAGLAYAPFLAFAISFIAADVYMFSRNGLLKNYGIGRMLSAYRKIAAYSVPIFIAELLSLVSEEADRLIISGFYSAAEAGVFDVAASLCLGYLIIANSYSNALLPLASSHEHHGPSRRSSLRKALKASVLLFAAYSVLLLVAGRPLIGLINPSYDVIFGFLYVLAPAYAMAGMLAILLIYMNSVGRQWHAVFSGAVFAFLNLAINLYLVPSILYWGAVLALLFSSAAALAVAAILIWKVEKCETKPCSSQHH